MVRESGPGARRLPSGRHSLSRDYVVGHQISRILSAVLELVGTNGYAALTVDAITAHAGVSRATFYVHFRNREDAFLRAFDSVLERLMTHVMDAHRGEAGAGGRLRAGVGAFLEFLAAEPLAARTCVVESLAAGPAAADRRDRAVNAFVQVIEGNTRELYPYYPEPALIAETIVGGIYEVAYTRIRRGETDRLPELLNGLLAAFAVPDPARWGPEAPLQG
ncbi:TetR/AcrR family transcriptional regulator [Actinocorallia longicatena]|uniref:HTH tetR-type domain-containing protein n=1 Tax=Actinocorallia longicatena TaxID=111803 RepID=A0ABP6QKF3_9ACTN